MKRLYLLLIIFSVLFLGACDKKESNKMSIIATNYVGYDLARAVTKDLDINTSMLLKPGAEIHGYEPSTADIISIIKSDIFIYVGGESDEEWVEKSILTQINSSKTTVINMFDVLKNDNNANLYAEEDPNGEEEKSEEYDEHIWNDYNNTLKILTAIKEAICNKDNTNKEKFESNYKSYYDEIVKTSNDIKTLFTNNANKDNYYLVFADRFPLLYFVKMINIDYDAALVGCSTATEASVKTMIRLKNKVEEKQLKYIFTIELSTQTIANALKKEIKYDIDNEKYNGAEPEILTFYSMHNISKDDYDLGLTFVDYMKKNYETMVKYFS